MSEIPNDPSQTEQPKTRGKVTIEVKATFDLDDAKIFDLQGKGLTITSIATN